MKTGRLSQLQALVPAILVAVSFAVLLQACGGKAGRDSAPSTTQRGSF